jgi:hypothetical protein
LPLSAHFEYFEQLAGRLAAAGAAVKEALAPLMPAFSAWLAKEDAVFRWTRRSEFTGHIADADAELDRVLVGVNAVVRVGLHAAAPVTKESAERVHNMLKNYGNVSRKSYEEKAGSVLALLENFAGPYAPDAAALGLDPWVQALQAALNNFNGLIRLRDDERVGKPRYTAREARRNLDAVYHQMAYIINANAAVSVSVDFATFIDHLNPEIARFNAEFHRVRRNLGVGGHTEVAAIPTQACTGQPITPVPTVYYRHRDEHSAVALARGKDFEVTDNINVKVGRAEVTIHGKGAYKGRVTVNFIIVES